VEVAGTYETSVQFTVQHDVVSHKTSIFMVTAFLEHPVSIRGIFDKICEDFFGIESGFGHLLSTSLSLQIS
jgi:hypothetical protein